MEGIKGFPGSLNIHLGSVWERKNKDLQRKMKEFRCGGHSVIFGLAEYALSVGLSLGEKM